MGSYPVLMTTDYREYIDLKFAQKIIGRYPQVSTDFLLLGRS